MCGRFNATFDGGVKKLYTSLNINKVIDKPIDSRFVKAADTVSIIRNVGEQRRVENATWWLLLDQTENGFKPSQYTSFNTRYDKLNVQVIKHIEIHGALSQLKALVKLNL